MRYRFLPAARSALGLLCITFILSTCQDYEFEGLSRFIPPKPNPLADIITAPSDVDVLFILDNTASMFNKQQNLASSLDAFIHVLNDRLGPDNTFSHPDDPAASPYRLTPVDVYYDFLMGLKNHRAGMVKFAAIVGTRDTGDLDTTTIEYTNDSDPNSRIESVCQTPGCTGDHCEAWPGTRYIRLAQKFGIGKQGFVDTICQTDFSATMEALGEFVYCPRIFNLSHEVLDPGLANIQLNDVAVPRYSCSESGSEIQECENTADTSCTCVETWSYHPPTGAPEAPGGTITFADHYDPCERVTEGKIRIELVYFTP